jgi:ribosomal protein S27E
MLRFFETETTVTDQPSEPTTRWVDCPGCDGEVGIPAGWAEDTVSCPQCGAVVAAKEESVVQWRKKEATDNVEVTPTPTAPDASPSPPRQYGIDPSPKWLSGALIWAPISLGLLVSLAVWHVGTEGDTARFDSANGIMGGVILNPGVWLLSWLCFYAYSKVNWLGCPHCQRRLKWPAIHRYKYEISCRVCKGTIIRPKKWS